MEWEKLCAKVNTMGWEQLGQQWDGKQSGREQDTAVRRHGRRQEQNQGRDGSAARGRERKPHG